MFIFLFLLNIANAQLQLFHLTEVSLEYHSFQGTPRLPEIFPYKGATEINLNLNMWIIKPFFWKNTVHTFTDQTPQFRLVGYLFQIGIILFDIIELGYQHHSQHMLDAVALPSGFPVRDDVYIKIYIVPPN